MYLAKIYVSLKHTVNDPQGLTVLGSLKQLGFSSLSDLRVGKYLEVKVEEEDRVRAEELVAEICQKLLANPVIEEFRFDLDEISSAAHPRIT